MDLTKIIETQSFIFDDAFEADETNELIYSRTIGHLVPFVFEGGKASCFAYGQTGSGETQLMTADFFPFQCKRIEYLMIASLYPPLSPSRPLFPLPSHLCALTMLTHQSRQDLHNDGCAARCARRGSGQRGAVCAGSQRCVFTGSVEK